MWTKIIYIWVRFSLYRSDWNLLYYHFNGDDYYNHLMYHLLSDKRAIALLNEPRTRVGEALLSVARGIHPHLSVESNDLLRSTIDLQGDTVANWNPLESIFLNGNRTRTRDTRDVPIARSLLAGFTVIIIHYRDETHHNEEDWFLCSHRSLR